MCTPANLDTLRKIVSTVNSELSMLPFEQRVKRARETLITLYTNYCVEGEYLKVVYKNRYGEKHVTRVKVYIDYTTAFKPLLVIEYPYLQLPRK